MTYQFPKDFLWGTATAAHQVEGNNINCDTWVLEHTPGAPYLEPSGDACDHYHRYREDIAMLAGLGFNTYRFSIEWCRVEPEDGFFSTAVLEHYRRMLATCHEHGLKPLVTLHHFTTPRWMMALGGWETPVMMERFARYCEQVVSYLGDLIYAACTINEANISSMLASMNYLPPVDMLRESDWWISAARKMGADPSNMMPFMYASTDTARHVILETHRKATIALKSGKTNFPVGITLALQDIQAVPGGEKQAQEARFLINDYWLEAIRGDDFVGVQNYSRMRFSAEGSLPSEVGVETTQMGYEFWPEALEATLREAARVAQIPIIITENGIGIADDSRRIAFIERALQGVIRCLKDGLDVRGYTYWSAMDNFEWNLGYTPTFGIIAVDRQTQVRFPKPSARWLGNIARANTF